MTLGYVRRNKAQREKNRLRAYYYYCKVGRAKRIIANRRKKKLKNDLATRSKR